VYSFACSATGGASNAELGFGGTDAGKRHLAHTVAGDDPFNALSGYIDPDYTTLHPIINPNKIRKLRWTYAADLQMGSYVRSEFQVVVSDWTVTERGSTIRWRVRGAYGSTIVRTR